MCIYIMHKLPTCVHVNVHLVHNMYKLPTCVHVNVHLYICTCTCARMHQLCVDMKWAKQTVCTVNGAHVHVQIPLFMDPDVSAFG